MATIQTLDIDVVPPHNPPGMGDVGPATGYYKGVRHKYPAAYLVTNLQDMVDQILLAAGSRSIVERLTIFGHGDDTGFRIGDDWISQKTLEDKKLRGQFERLKGIFTGTGMVIIHACHTGKADALLIQLSALMGGVSVRGGTWYQWPMRHLWGDVKTCKVSLCTTK